MNLRDKKSLLVYCYSNLPNFSTHENIFGWLLQSVPDSITKGRAFDKVVFPNLMIHVEFSKCLCHVSLNKGMLKCKTFILTPSKFTCTCRHVLLSHAIYTYSSTDIFFCRRPFRLIRPSGRFLFYCHSSHELTRPSRRFLSFAMAYTDQTVHKDVFLSLTYPTQANLFTQTDAYFPLSQSTQANSSTRTFSFH